MFAILKYIKPAVLVAMLLLGKTVLAQDTSSVIVPAKRSYFKLSAGYLTNAVYNGRKDSVTTPYLTGSLGYYHKSGLSLSGSFSYNTSSGMVDVFSLDAGYDLDISDKLTISIDGNKPFYNASSTAVESGVKGTFGADVLYEPGIVNIDAGANAVFSDKTDLLMNGALSHQFSFSNTNGDASFSLTPTFTVNLGTQNFYQNYLVRSAKKKNLAVTSSSVSGSNSFGLLDQELSLPVAYDAKKWGISAISTYALPQDPISTTTTNTITIFSKTYNTISTSTEKLQNVFYAQITLYLKF